MWPQQAPPGAPPGNSLPSVPKLPAPALHDLCVSIEAIQRIIPRVARTPLVRQNAIVQAWCDKQADALGIPRPIVVLIPAPFWLNAQVLGATFATERGTAAIIMPAAAIGAIATLSDPSGVTAFGTSAAGLAKLTAHELSHAVEIATMRALSMDPDRVIGETPADADRPLFRAAVARLHRAITDTAPPAGVDLARWPLLVQAPRLSRALDSLADEIGKHPVPITAATVTRNAAGAINIRLAHLVHAARPVLKIVKGGRS